MGPIISVKRSTASHVPSPWPGRGPPRGPESNGADPGPDFGHVVDQIVEKDLQRRKRQEGQDQRGQRHRHHVAEVRTRPHPNVFHDVGVGSPALRYPVRQHA